MFETLFSFALATIVLAISPGPDNIFVLTQSIVNGKKFGLATVLGLMSGCIIHTTLVAFGVSAILKENESIFFFIKMLGAAYLLYLAFKIYKSDVEIVLNNKADTSTSVLQLFKKGFIMNVLNPKVTLFFLAFFPQFLFSENLSNVVQFYVLGAIFIATTFLVFGTLALLAGSVSNYLKTHSKIGVYLKWGQIIVFVFIAIMILI
ncbi:LysE family translocator [uncultured Polaribacter sp.]|uniref:LysE family translocator n=1 Tax=uncultured Polaribacter sp. TaxID=174711 RepID=UPI00261A405B|nr:LysE family translocator [uncultured Polaribacter sp.]